MLTLLRHSIRATQVRQRSLYQKVRRWVLDEEDAETTALQQQPIVKQSLSVGQEIQDFVSLQEEIGNLERIRMQKLDETLGTTTHFHETEAYEERLDSETIMERKSLVRKELEVEKQRYFASVFSPDPQKRIKTPWIKDMGLFQKQAIDQVPYPKHNKHYVDGDFFKYFEEQHYDEKEVMYFLGRENMYTQLVQIRMIRREEIVRQRYTELLVESVAPIVYDGVNYVHKNMDVGYNIYKCVNQTTELVMDGEHIVKVLPEQYADFKLDIQEQLIPQLYKDFQPNQDHTRFGVIVEYQDNNILIVDQQFIENVGDSFAFNGDDIGYIEKSELGVQKFIISLDNKQNKTTITEIPIGQTASIVNIDEKQSYIRITDTNGYDNQILDNKGNVILPFQQGIHYKVDSNDVNTFYTKQTQLMKPQTLYTLSGDVVYQCKNEQYIESFSTNDNYIAIILKDIHNNIINNQQLLIIKDNNNYHILNIQEQQYQIEQENNQIKSSQDYYFQLICPYKPFTIIKYNVDTKQISIQYQQDIPGFDLKSLTTELMTANNQQIAVTYNQQQPIGFVVIKLQDSNLSLSPEDVIIIESGGAICSITVDQFNYSEIKTNLEQITLKLKVLSDKIVILCNGRYSSLIGSWQYFNQQHYYISLLAHNGIYQYKDVQCYDIQRIPALKNTLFTYTPNEDQHQTQRIVALLRENPRNNVDLKKQELGVNMIESENEADLEVQRLAYLLTVLM